MYAGKTLFRKISIKKSILRISAYYERKTGGAFSLNKCLAGEK